MSNEVLVALIGAVSAVLVVVAPLVVQRLLKCKNDDSWTDQAETDTPKRLATLAGDWRGLVNQDLGRDCPLQYDILMKCHFDGQKVTGFANIVHPGSERGFTFDFTGVLAYERFFRMDYKNRQDTTIQFGSMILELDDEGTCLAGRFIGYGAISRGIVGGQVEVKKQ